MIYELCLHHFSLKLNAALFPTTLASSSLRSVGDTLTDTYARALLNGQPTPNTNPLHYHITKGLLTAAQAPTNAFYCFWSLCLSISINRHDFQSCSLGAIPFNNHRLVWDPDPSQQLMNFGHYRENNDPRPLPRPPPLAS